MQAPKLRLLIAEDDPECRETLRRILTKQGYAVDTVADGNALLRQAILGKYELIITDIVMPGLWGHAAVKPIRMSGCRLPILGITGMSDAETKTIKHSFVALLHKPIDIPELLECIEKHYKDYKRKEEEDEDG